MGTDGVTVEPISRRLCRQNPDAILHFAWEQEWFLRVLHEYEYDGNVIFYQGFDLIDLNELGHLIEGAYSLESQPEPIEDTEAFEYTFGKSVEGD